MKRLTFLVTAGPTREYLDPVRYLSNPSTGKMGYAVARAAKKAGGRVILVTGPTTLRRPAVDRLVEVDSAEEMRKAVMRWVKGADVVVMCAAVADYRPVRCTRRKMKKTRERLVVEMVRTRDILGELGGRKGKRFLVGFAAETDHLIANARRELAAKNLDLVVANDVTKRGAGFASDTNEVTLVSRSGAVVRWPMMSKRAVAQRLVRHVVKAYGEEADA